MSTDVKEQLERKGNPIEGVSVSKTEVIGGKRPTPTGKQLLLEKGGKA